MSQTCIVYMLTCATNGKYYIGQTINTLEKRWAQHKSNAKKKAQKCKFLENAIEKYGHENFTIEALVYCNQDKLNFYETKFVDMYMSNNRIYGYNICEGGGGSISRPVNDDHRQKISVANKKTTLPINIQERRDKNGTLTGYVVAKTIKKVRYNKNFGETKNSLDENLRLATEWLESLNLGTMVENKYNRPDSLPRNISYKRNSAGDIIGYQVKVERKGKVMSESFTRSDITMEEKLQTSIEYKAKCIEELSKN